MDLLGYNFLSNNNVIQKFSEVKELVEEVLKVMLDYVNGFKYLINYTHTIYTLYYRSKDGTEMCKFDNITVHMKQPDKYGEV